MNTQTYRVLKKHSMLNNVKLVNLATSATYLVDNRIQGDFVECGVWMGGGAAVVAQTLLEKGDVRTLRLFDSFNDICEPLPVDGKLMIKQVGGPENAKGRLQPVEGFYNSLGRKPGNHKVVYNLLKNVVGYPTDKIKIYKGWFQKTLAPYSKRIEKIALLSLDCDLYESTKICLEHLYDKVVPGGLIIIDDYVVYDGCKIAVDSYFKERNLCADFTRVGQTGCISWVKGVSK